MTDTDERNAAEREREEEELETFGVRVCQTCGAEMPVMTECYPTVCGTCGGNKFYPIAPKPEKAAFLPKVGIIDDYTL